MSEASHFVNGGDLVELVDAGTSRDALAYVAEHRPSCHSDPGEALIQSASACEDWIAYSPSFENCLYVALVSRRTIFALGLGQRYVAYRLPEAPRATALAQGATQAPQIGPDWVRFELYQLHRPAVNLPWWTLGAYTAVWEGAERTTGPARAQA